MALLSGKERIFTMEIREIMSKYYNGDYTYKTAHIPKKVWNDHIFDEDLSVRRNRELAKEHNDMVDSLTREANIIQGQLNEKLTNDVVNCIIDDYGLSETQARIVEEFVYNEYHSSMNDYFNNIDVYADFASSLISSH